MKFVSYMLYVLPVWSCLGPMLMRGKFLWKMLHFDHGYITCLYVLFYLVGDARAQIVAILLVCVSCLACCSALCIFEKHLLAFVDLIHALPTRGSTQFMFPGGVLHWGKKNWEKCICLGGACIHALGGSFRLNFSCALFPMVSSPCASPWGVSIFGAFYLGCVEPLPLP
jgi:hypothetical protein